MGGIESRRRKGSHGSQTAHTKAKISAGQKAKKGTKEYGIAYRTARRKAEAERQIALERAAGFYNSKIL